MRAILGALLALVVAAPAQARYLHIADARPAAKYYVGWLDSGGKLGRCWHQGPHVVQCSYTLTGVIVCDKAVSDTCAIDFVNEPGESHWFAVIVQRPHGLYAHTLWVDKHSLLVG